MDKPAAIAGTFADLKSVKTRSIVQLVIEVPIEQAEAVIRAFGYPQPGHEIPVAVARLVEPTAPVAQLEEPQNSTLKVAGSSPAGGTKPAKDRRHWSTLSFAEQAGIRCAEPAFWRYLSEVLSKHSISNDVEAARFVRHWCGVESRSELKPLTPAGKAWTDLDRQFDLWLRDVAA